MANFSISYKFRAIDKFTPVANNISRKIDAIAKKITPLNKKFQKLGKTLTSLGKKMMLRVTAPILAAGAAMIHTAGKFEMIRTQFESMFGSAAKARKEMEFLKTFDVRTPFKIDQMVRADTALQQFGFSIKKSHQLLSQLGDLAASQPQNFGYLAQVIGRVHERGAIYYRGLRTMVTMNIPIIRELKKMAAEAGHPNVDIFGIAAKGGITFATVEKALTRMTQKGGIFYKHMIMQSQTFVGMMNTLKNQIAINILLPLGNVLMETLGIKKGIKGLNNALMGTGKRIEAWAAKHKTLTKIIIYTGILLASLAPILITLGLLANGFAVAIAIAASPITLIVAGVLAIGVGIFYLYKHFKSVRDIVDLIWRTIKDIWVLIKPIVTFLAKVGLQLAKFQFKTLLAVFKALLPILKLIGKTIYYTLIIPLKWIIKSLDVIIETFSKQKQPAWRKNLPPPAKVNYQTTQQALTTFTPGLAQKHQLNISIADPGKNVSSASAVSGSPNMGMSFDKGANMAHAR